MQKILVTGASGLIGYGILRSISMSAKEYKLIGTTIYEDSVAQAFCDIFEKAPYTQAENYFDWMAEIVSKHNIDLLIPSFEDDVQTWSENRDRINSTGAKAVLNDRQLIRLCKDKWLFYEYLHQHKCASVIPTTLSNDFDEIVAGCGLPFLLKPRQGSESKGIVTVNDQETFKKHRSKVGPELMAQPIVGNNEEEYTTAAFCDGKGGFYNIITLKRKLAKLGYTEKAEVVHNDLIEQAVGEICKYLNPVGPTNFQFRIQEDRCYLLEINPRFSAATSIRTGFGYNEALMAVEYYLENMKPVQPELREGRAVRYIEDHFFYV